MLSAVYASLARRRRQWFDSHPDARRRLGRPVVSVGNLAIGGTGKTPVVAYLAHLLLEAGERPAILSRGYGRRVALDGVVVVRDRRDLRADLDHAGDEPLMLARRLEGVPVLVAVDRHLAGVLAERHLDASVHLLDDGFQHMMLERDVDLVLLDAGDVEEPRTLPGGRLREAIDAVARADGVVLTGGSHETAARLRVLGAPRVFRSTRTLEAPRWVRPGHEDPPGPAPARVLAVSAIARPDRFEAALRAAGWTVVDQLRFRDHHRYSRPDVDRIARRARAARADLVLTTEKDLVRLLPLMPVALPLAWVPLSVHIEPAGEFRAWLLDRLAAARDQRLGSPRASGH